MSRPSLRSSSLPRLLLLLGRGGRGGVAGERISPVAVFPVENLSGGSIPPPTTSGSSSIDRLDGRRDRRSSATTRSRRS